MTLDEEEIYRSLLTAIAKGREAIIAHVSHTERPLTGKKDISQEYEIVRLLDSVPMFVGVDGRNYLLSRDDVVALPAVHARNLHNKKLAIQVKLRDDVL
jgi:DNA replication factor GINS